MKKMKKWIGELIKRGLLSAWGGPVVLAIIYLILQANGVITTLSVNEVCKGILSSAAMAFVAGGITSVYQAERLPLPTAIMIHCAVLYLDYILVYLINGWLKNQLIPIMVFTVVFVAGFALIWLLIYRFSKKDVDKINAKLQHP